MDILHRIKALLHHPKPVQISASHKAEHTVLSAAESMTDNQSSILFRRQTR